MASRKSKPKKSIKRSASPARAKAKVQTTKAPPRRKVAAGATPKAARKAPLDPKIAAAIALALEAESAADANQAAPANVPSGWQLSGRARRTHTR